MLAAVLAAYLRATCLESQAYANGAYLSLDTVVEQTGAVMLDAELHAIRIPADGEYLIVASVQFAEGVISGENGGAWIGRQARVECDRAIIAVSAGAFYIAGTPTTIVEVFGMFHAQAGALVKVRIFHDSPEPVRVECPEQTFVTIRKL